MKTIAIECRHVLELVELVASTYFRNALRLGHYIVHMIADLAAAIHSCILCQ